MKKTMSRVTLCLGLLSAPVIASAIQYSWDLNQLGVTSGASLVFESTPGGVDLTVTAFRSKYWDGSGNLVDATVRADGGLGVTHSYDSGYPDAYTLDNNGHRDVLVFDSGVANFDWNSLKLSNIYSGSGGDGSPNLSYWAGNGDGSGLGAATDFNTLCLTGSGCSLASNGFSNRTDLYGLSTSPKTLTTGNSGRYLVVSGALVAPGEDGKYDKFKISTVAGVPEPQSMALVGIGLLAMLGMRRRLANTIGRQVLSA